jgi:hypothetical protein
MDVLADAAMFEAMDVSATDGGGMAAGASNVNVDSAGVEMAAVDVSTVDKENTEVRQRGSDQQDPAFERTLIACVPMCGGQANGNHFNEAVNGGASKKATSSCVHAQHAQARERRRSSPAQLHQPYHRPQVGERRHLRLHVVQHAAHLMRMR